MNDEYDNPVTLPSPFRTLDDVREHNRATGHYFFSADTMRFFSSRVCGDLIAGRFFVTSERDTYRGSEPRYYTVRVALDDGRVNTMGSFQQYASLSGAKAAAERLGRLLREGVNA